jgi:hypothetical protein
MTTPCFVDVPVERPATALFGQLGLGSPNRCDNVFGVEAAAEAPTKLAAVELFGDEKGSGDALRSVLAVATAHNLYLIPQKWCVVLAPPVDHNQAICTIWPQSKRLKVSVWFESIEAFLGVPQDRARAIMGQDIYRYVPIDEVGGFNDDLIRLMAASVKT